MAADLQMLVRIARVVTLTSLALFILVLSLGILVWPPAGKQPSLVIWGIVILPLLAMLPGVLARRSRTHMWLCFLLCLYFFVSMPPLFEPDYRWLDVAEVVLEGLLFVSSMLFVRWQSRAQRALQPVDETQ